MPQALCFVLGLHVSSTDWFCTRNSWIIWICSVVVVGCTLAICLTHDRCCHNWHVVRCHVILISSCKTWPFPLASGGNEWIFKFRIYISHPVGLDTEYFSTSFAVNGTWSDKISWGFSRRFSFFFSSSQSLQGLNDIFLLTSCDVVHAEGFCNRM